MNVYIHSQTTIDKSGGAYTCVWGMTTNQEVAEQIFALRVDTIMNANKSSELVTGDRDSQHVEIRIKHTGTRHILDLHAKNIHPEVTI